MEYFPLNILLQIFSRIDDIDLLNLAENSSRFESIVKVILIARYAHKYFLIDAIEYSSETFNYFFDIFGNEVKAIEVHAIKINKLDEKYDWITALLNRTSKLEKLKLNLFQIHESDADFLQHYRGSNNITHFTLCSILNSTSNGLILPEFHNLKKLDLLSYPSISFETLEKIIFSNSGLERLCISDKIELHGAAVKSTYPFDDLMVLISKAHLNQLKEFLYVPFWNVPIPYAIQIRRQPDNYLVDAFVDSLKNLESLILSSDVNLFTDWTELLFRFASQCKNIKHLQLYKFQPNRNRLMAINSFQHLESLLLALYNSDSMDSVIDWDWDWEFLVDNLPPLLHHLYIKMLHSFMDWSFILMLLQKCSNLNKLTIASDLIGFNFDFFSTAQFFYDFNDSMRMRDITIEVKAGEEIIGI